MLFQAAAWTTAAFILIKALNLNERKAPMVGETNLDRLLANMEPVLAAPVFDFLSWPADTAVPAHLEPLMVFREAEGLTLIVELEKVQTAGLQSSFPCRMITLNIHSSLAAIGFLAAILPRLAAAGMGVNPVSGFYHDHLFVPADRATDAMDVLRLIARENASKFPDI